MIKEPTRIEPAFTKKELEALAIARSKEIVFDEDCPETTPERAIKFRRVHPQEKAIAE